MPCEVGARLRRIGLPGGRREALRRVPSRFLHLEVMGRSSGDLRTGASRRVTSSRRTKVRLVPRRRKGRTGDGPQDSVEGTESAAGFYPTERPEIVRPQGPRGFSRGGSRLARMAGVRHLLAGGTCWSRSSARASRRSGRRKSKAVHRPANAPAIAPIERDFLCLRLDRAARWVRFVKARPGSEAAMRGERENREWSKPRHRCGSHGQSPRKTSSRTHRLRGSPRPRSFSPAAKCSNAQATTSRQVSGTHPRRNIPPCRRAPTMPTPSARRGDSQTFSEFPFVDDVDSAAFLAYILTPLRPDRDRRTNADDVGSIHQSAAPAKSKLATAGGTIGTGREPALMVPTDDEEELRKGGSRVRAGGHPALCIIDNAAGAFGSKQLAAILTMRNDQRTRARRVEDRDRAAAARVGRSPGTTFTFKKATSPARHACPDRPKDGAPGKSEIQIANLGEHIREERARLAVAGLTILRAFHVAQRPHNIGPGEGSRHGARSCAPPSNGRSKPTRGRVSPVRRRRQRFRARGLSAMRSSPGKRPSARCRRPRAAACARAAGRPGTPGDALRCSSALPRRATRRPRPRLPAETRQEPDRQRQREGCHEFVKDGEDRDRWRPVDCAGRVSRKRRAHERPSCG